MAKVELKKPVVEEISANLEGAVGVVLVDHCGLTVEQDTQLRKQMRAEGSGRGKGMREGWRRREKGRWGRGVGGGLSPFSS